MLYLKSMSARKQQKGFAILIVIAFIAILGIGYLLFSSKTQKPNNRNESTGTVNKTLQTACNNALNDYPEWTKNETDIVIWENPDKSFNFRNSPEDASSRLTSPIPSAETLTDMDFIGINEIAYATTKENQWKLSTLKLNGLNAPTNSLIYEKTEAVSFLNISPVSGNEFIVLVVSGNKGILKHINTESSKEEIILEIPSIKTTDLKLSVSPKGTYVYLLQDKSLILFEIALKKQIERVSSVSSAVWIGDGYALYSGSEGTFVYNLKTKEKSKIDKLGPVSALTFNPKENGIIAFTEAGDAKIVNCLTWKSIFTKQGAELKTLTSEKTAIIKKGDQYGFWRYQDWGVNFLEEKSKFVTVWQRY
jgi:hypothetical protein